MSRKFSKPALGLEDQVKKLRDRGLDADPEQLKATLARMSYYRFSGYLWWFYEDDHRIRESTSLQDVLELYAFDAKLRVLVLRMSHSIEVWLRAAFANEVCQRHGPMGYLSKGIYANPVAFDKDVAKLDEMITDKSPEAFVTAFRQNYSDKRPPLWMATELMSLGLLSKWYENLREDSLAKAIAKGAGLNRPALVSFLRLFTVLRNGAAHHSRIWNRTTSLRGVTIKSPPPELRAALDGADESRIHYVLAIAAYIVGHVDPCSESVDDLRQLLETAREEWLVEMDFPLGFDTDPLWRQ